MYKSEIIKPSLIKELKDLVNRKKYKKYLFEVRIKNLRVFEDANITFDFPITAIIGPNGSGKSTVLMASGCAYKDVKPSDFFANSNIDNISNAKIEYSLIDKDESKERIIRRTISFKSQKWSRKRILERNVRYFGVRRTVPPAELKELFKLRSSKIFPTEEIKLNEDEIKIINWILGIGSEYKLSQFTTVKKNIFVGSKGNVSYSEFHFGAGESSITRLVYELERIEENSLILIEEIENGLHPLALRKFIEYLFKIAKRKRLQIIFTTHSPIAIEMLPEEAVWYCLNGKIYQGKPDIDALRVITGNISKKLIIFVEDEFAKQMLMHILRHTKKFKVLEVIEIYLAGGKDAVKKFTETFNQNPAIKEIKAIGVFDGDVDEDISEDFFLKLPGNNMPEKEVWEKVKENLEEIIGKLAIKLLDYEDQEFIKEKIIEVDRDTIDYHYIYNKLGEKLGYLSESKIRDAFIEIYCSLNREEINDIANQLENIFQKYLYNKNKS